METKVLETRLRAIEIRKGLPFAPLGSSGFFHGWCKEPYFYDEAGSCLPRTYALVELPDGNIRMVEPDWIRFTDPFDKREETSRVK